MPLTDAIVLACVLFAVCGAVWGLTRLRRLLVIGASYKAKVLASLIFSAGRGINPNTADEVSADSYRPMRLLRARVDPDARAVTASFLGLWPRRTRMARDISPPAAGAASPTPWSTASGPAPLARIVDAAFSEPNPKRLRRTRAIIVVQDGRIIAEQYARGFNADTRFAGWSMTKSVFSALVGILVGEGRLSLQQNALLPEWRDTDPRAAITIEDLLRMRSGLVFSEDYADLTSDVIEMLFNRTDASAYAARKPLAAPAGTAWSYASGATNILARIARNVIGDADYFEWPRRVLFDPLGMTSAVIEADASGTFVASSFMVATTRDWARFGQLYLQDGAWNGRRILPVNWVRFSTTPTPQSPQGIYGAHWWLGLKPEIGGGTVDAARIPADAYFAVGHEAQTLTVIPSRRLVVVRLGLSIYIDAWNHAEFIARLFDALDAA